MSAASLQYQTKSAWLSRLWGQKTGTQFELTPNGLSVNSQQGGHSWAMQHIAHVAYGHRYLNRYFARAVACFIFGLFFLVAYHSFENIFNYGLKRTNAKVNMQLNKLAGGVKAETKIEAKPVNPESAKPEGRQDSKISTMEPAHWVNLNNYALHVPQEWTDYLAYGLLGLSALLAALAWIGQTYLQIGSNHRETVIVQSGKRKEFIAFGKTVARVVLARQRGL